MGGLKAISGALKIPISFESFFFFFILLGSDVGEVHLVCHVQECGFLVSYMLVQIFIIYSRNVNHVRELFCMQELLLSSFYCVYP